MKKLIAVLIVITGVGIGLYMLERPTSGVQPVAWDRASCAHCHMHIGDRHFAAQLQTKDGKVLNYDDPGCLFEYVVANGPSIKVAYFHHYQTDEWLNYREVRFVETDVPTPMGYGIGAVREDEAPEGMTFEEASQYVLTQSNTHERGPR